MFKVSVQNTTVHILRIMVFMVFLVTMIAGFAFAEGGDGNGNGSANNRDIPLTLMNSSISDGQTDVPVDTVIELDFNKNVCNISELQANSQCFHLIDTRKSNVQAQIIFPDTQVQRDLRREVFIRPSEDLSANTVYRIVIDDTLQAKNGTCLDHAYTISFTTGSGPEGVSNEKLDSLGEYVVSFDSSKPPASVSSASSASLDEPGEENHHNAKSISLIVAILLLICAAVLTLIVIRLRRTRE